ncbi:MAG: polysaccharide lyase 6 family protein [Kiritimatiellales bacterium]
MSGVSRLRRIAGTAGFLLSTAFFALSAEYSVSNATQFAETMSLVQPGDEIVWQDGTYDDLGSLVFEPSVQGTEALPITLRAETPGGVIFRGNTYFNLGGHYLVLSGFRFDNSDYPFSDSDTAYVIINFRAHSDLDRHAYNCRVTDCAFIAYDNPSAGGSAKWIEMYGAANRFDHNYVSGKTTRGALLVVELSDQTNQITAAHTIDSNVFADRLPGPLDNEYETVRVGTSIYSDENAHVTVEHNFFYRCSGEAEIVSNKSCENTYRNNTFVECAGSLTLRHGRGCRVEGNLFLGHGIAGSGGIRVANSDHIIVNNCMQDLAGTGYQAAFAIMYGSTNTQTNPDLLGSYGPVDNVILAHNTLVNVAEAVNYGVGKKKDRQLPPNNVTFAANIVSSTHAPLFSQEDPPTHLTNLNNIVWGASAGLAADPDLVVTNPLLAADCRGIFRPVTNSPAIGAAGTQTVLGGDLLDMDGALRPLVGRDIGADQVGSGAQPTAPLSTAEIGPGWLPLLIPAAIRITMDQTTSSISVTGTPNTRYVLETTTNLLSSWVPLMTNAADENGRLEFSDTDAAGSQQFYRTVQ